MTGEELVGELRDAGVAALAVMLAVPADRLSAGAYENGWNVRQLLAHLASMEYAYGRLPEPASQVATGRVTTGGGVSIGEYNARQVERREGRSVDELLDEFTRGRARLLIQAQALDAALLAAHVRSTGGTSGTLAQVLAAVAGNHVTTHVRDLSQATGAVPTAANHACAALLLAAEEAAQRCEAAPTERWPQHTGDDWSAAAIAGHLAELMPYWATKAAEAVATPGAIVGRDLDAPERLGGVASGESLSPADAAALLRRSAAKAVSVLNAIRIDDWSAPLPTIRFDTIPLEQVVALLLVGHAREHVAQLRAALATRA